MNTLEIARRKHKMTRNQPAEKVGATEARVQHWPREDTPTLPSEADLVRLCEVLRLRLDITRVELGILEPWQMQAIQENAKAFIRWAKARKGDEA